MKKKDRSKWNQINRKPNQRHLEHMMFARLGPEVRAMDRACHETMRQDNSGNAEERPEGEGVKVKSARVNGSTPGDSTIKAGEQAMPCDEKPMVSALVRPHQDRQMNGLTGYGNNPVSTS